MTVTATVEPEAIHDADGNPESQLESPRRMHLALAEATLWMVHLAAALQFRRVFETDEFLLRVVALFTVTSASSVLARLRRLPTAASTAASVAVTLVVAAWLWFPSTTAWGVPDARLAVAVLPEEPSGTVQGEVGPFENRQQGYRRRIRRQGPAYRSMRLRERAGQTEKGKHQEKVHPSQGGPYLLLLEKMHHYQVVTVEYRK